MLISLGRVNEHEGVSISGKNSALFCEVKSEVQKARVKEDGVKWGIRKE